eukprot:g17314.t1
MSTGNPYGLSEISHYGSMRNVGGKAGGFINKKFFHPSSLRNQERLWKAITADAVEKRKQDDLEKAREEERKVDALRKEITGRDEIERKKDEQNRKGPKWGIGSQAAQT